MRICEGKKYAKTYKNVETIISSSICNQSAQSERDSFNNTCMLICTHITVEISTRICIFYGITYKNLRTSLPEKPYRETQNKNERIRNTHDESGEWENKKIHKWEGAIK